MSPETERRSTKSRRPGMGGGIVNSSPNHCSWPSALAGCDQSAMTPKTVATATEATRRT